MLLFLSCWSDWLQSWNNKLHWCTLQSIRAVLADAEKRQFSEEPIGAENPCIPKPKISSCLPSSCVCFKQVSLRHDIALQIKDIKKQLDAIENERNQFNFVSSSTIQQPHRRISSSVIDVSQFCGRDADINILIGKLLGGSCQESSSLYIISIVGMGGIGKTTLAQLAYNHEKVKSYFHERMWVFPTVLDVVWTESYELWEQVESSLKGGAPGSRILVTTRNENVSTMMGTTYKHPLGELSKEQCWSLFSNIAFYGRSREKVEELENIGRKIADKCRGLPLAAKVLGSLMRLKDNKEDWESILNNEIWQLDVIEKHLSTPLLLSYYDLSPAMEKTGGDYFEDLVSRSLFQDFRRDDEGNIISCKMHDIVHDLAQYLTKNECFILEIDDEKEVRMASSFQKARHATCLISTESVGFASTIHNLKYLHTLLATGWWSIGVAKRNRRLTSLQTLTGLRIIGVCKIGELKNLNSLRGGLVISGIANVKDAKEAGEAELKNKKHLHQLELEDFGRLASAASKGVAEALQPHQNLKSLKISHYDAATEFPSWIAASSLAQLKKLEIVYCAQVTCLPPLGELPLLESLIIEHMKRVKYVGGEFLGSSSTTAFPKLKHLLGSKEEDDEEEGRSVMPCLHSLTTVGCPKLESLPERLLQITPLQVLDIRVSPTLQDRYHKETGRIGPKYLTSETFGFNH
ncbi:hypothetical protein AAG906_029734 [Vitis piasezkii]